MRGVLADHNCGGQLDRLVAVLSAGEWADLWISLLLDIETFGNLGLDRETSDRDIWNLCQAERLVLITINRNEEGPDSLGVVLEESGGQDALPVLTIADGQRVTADSRYAERTAVRLLELLLDIRDRPDTILATGRRFIP